VTTAFNAEKGDLTGHHYLLQTPLNGEGIRKETVDVVRKKPCQCIALIIRSKRRRGSANTVDAQNILKKGFRVRGTSATMEPWKRLFMKADQGDVGGSGDEEDDPNEPRWHHDGLTFAMLGLPIGASDSAGASHGNKRLTDE
jgi:hypothetical protein